MATFILRWRFPEADIARYADLSERVQLGVLSEAELRELDDYLGVNAFLIIMQSKARRSLKRSA